MHRAFGAAMPFEEFKPRQEDLWQRRQEQFGQFKGVTILGTVPGQGDYVTTARIDFERGVDYAQFMWGGGVLRGMRLSIRLRGFSSSHNRQRSLLASIPQLASDDLERWLRKKSFITFSSPELKCFEVSCDDAAYWSIRQFDRAGFLNC